MTRLSYKNIISNFFIGTATGRSHIDAPVTSQNQADCEELAKGQSEGVARSKPSLSNN